MIGPFPTPVYGMSVVNQQTYHGLQQRGVAVSKIDFKSSSEKIDDKQGSFSLVKFTLLLKYLQWYKIVYHDVVYITIGLTYFGVIKYLPFILIAKMLGKKLIFHSHGNYLHQEYEQLIGYRKKQFKKALNYFDKGIALTPTLKENLKNLYPLEKTVVIENFVDESERLAFIDSQKNKDYSQFKILFMSNLLKEKGINTLVESLLALQQEGIVIRTTIAGSIPPSNMDILTEIQRLDDTKFVGLLSGYNKQKALENSTVFCLPTYYPMEGQPLSILEAMSAGNMIITTQHAGIPDFCTEKNALFVEKNDVQSLTNTLKFVFENPSIIQEKGSYNHQYANEKYTFERYINNIISLFKEVYSTKEAF